MPNADKESNNHLTTFNGLITKNNLLTMKKTLFLLTLCMSCYELKLDCKTYKTGKFESETTVNGQNFKSSFERNDSIQIENFRNKIDTFSIRWVNDCEYILENIKPKSRKEQKAIQVRIMNTNDEGYTFEYSFIGDEKKEVGIVTKLKP